MSNKVYILMLLSGSALYFGSGLWIVILALRRNFWFGVACFCFPMLQWVYVALNWREGRTPLFVQIAGFVLVMLTVLIRYLTRGS